MKKDNVYGIKMTDLESMMFSKYLENNRIAMNTKTESERTQIARDWLNENENKYIE